MRPIPLLQPWLFLSVAILASGCASPREAATFVTKTSFSLLDADTSPAGVSIAFDRVEGYLGPRFVDGSVFPVAAAIEASGSGFDRKIRQVYATGNAARIVTNKGVRVVPPPGTSTAVSEERNKVVFFGTGTTIGLKIGFAAGTPVPESFTLGYKRKELSVIPVDPGREPSVLGTFNNAAGLGEVPQGAAQAPVKFDVEQYFATGAAAENLATFPSIWEKFRQTAERAVGDVEKYRAQEAMQARFVLDTLKCFSELPDDRVDRVWINAEDLGVFRDWKTVPRILAIADRQRQRQIYMGDLGLLSPDDLEYTTTLKIHQKVVCDMRNPRP